MSVTDLIASNNIRVADEFYLMELWGTTQDPPYHSYSYYRMFEGGVVESVTDDVVTLDSDITRQVIDPLDRSDSYGTTLSKNHANRYLLIWDGAAVCSIYKITSNTVDTITCDGQDFSAVAAGDIAIICDLVKPESASCGRDIDKMMATANITVARTAAQTNLIRPMTWIYWRKRIWSGTQSVDWFDVGWFCVTSVDDDEDPAKITIQAEALDALKLLNSRPYEGIIASDKISMHGRVGTANTDAIVLDMIDESGGTDDGFYRFVDSPETASDAVKLANHTFNWCQSPPVVIYKSADTNPTISAGDELVLTSDAVQILYGSGEIRIQAKTYNDDFVDESLPNIKVQYYRYANYNDCVRGVVTSITGTNHTLNDTGLAAGLALPTTGNGIKDATLRITSGLARGLTYTITSNTASTVTVAEDLVAAGLATNDTYELFDINDPMRIIESLLLNNGYQMANDALPLYVSALDDILLADQPASVQTYDGADYANITDAVKNETTTSALLAGNGDIVYVGHTMPFTRLYALMSTGVASGNYTMQYYGSLGWTTLPTRGKVNTQFADSGLMMWNGVNDWRVYTVNGAGPLFWVRFVQAGAGTSGTVKRMQVMDRVSAPSMQYTLSDNTTAEQIITKLREDRMIRPNWFLYADESGVIQGQEVTQSAAADWTMSKKLAVRRSRGDDDVYTGILYKGHDPNPVDLAVSDGTVAIDTTDELDALISSGDAKEGYPNDDTIGLPLVIDGVDYRDITKVSGDQLKQRWQYVTDEFQSVRDLDNVPLWYVSLDQSYSDLSKVELVLDGMLAQYCNWNESGGFAVQGLEVSNDTGVYSALTWLPLCSEAQAFSAEGGVKTYTFESGSDAWQSTWKHIRLKSVIAAECNTRRHKRVFFATAFAIELRVYRSPEQTKTLWLGEDVPFTGTEYLDMVKRYGRRLFVMPYVDYSATTEGKRTERAIDYLKELVFISPEVPVEGVRPDAKLFDTIQLTQAEMSIDRLMFVKSMTIGTGAQTSIVAQDYTL